MTRMGRGFTANSAVASREDAAAVAATGAAAGELPPPPLERMTSRTRSRSSGEMLARAEFLIVIPAFAQ